MEGTYKFVLDTRSKDMYGVTYKACMNVLKSISALGLEIDRDSLH